jgi:hypothetical protein
MLTILKREYRQYKEQAAACVESKTARYYAERATAVAMEIATIEAEYSAIIEGSKK